MTLAQAVQPPSSKTVSTNDHDPIGWLLYRLASAVAYIPMLIVNNLLTTGPTSVGAQDLNGGSSYPAPFLSKNRMPTDKDFLAAIKLSDRQTPANAHEATPPYIFHVIAVAMTVWMPALGLACFAMLVPSFYRRCQQVQRAGAAAFTAEVSHLYASIGVELLWWVFAISSAVVATGTIHRAILSMPIFILIASHGHYYGNRQDRAKRWVQAMLRLVLPLWVTYTAREVSMKATHFFATRSSPLDSFNADFLVARFKHELETVAQEMESTFLDTPFVVLRMELRFGQAGGYHLLIAAAVAEENIAPSETSETVAANVQTGRVRVGDTNGATSIVNDSVFCGAVSRGQASPRQPQSSSAEPTTSIRIGFCEGCRAFKGIPFDKA